MGHRPRAGLNGLAVALALIGTTLACWGTLPNIFTPYRHMDRTTLGGHVYQLGVRYLAKNGPGLHHVAYQVGDIDATLHALREAGLALIDEQARTGIRGSRVAFLHPRSTAGVLTEIVEPAHVAASAAHAGGAQGAAGTGTAGEAA